MEGGSARDARERVGRGPSSSEGFWKKNSTYRLLKLRVEF